MLVSNGVSLEIVSTSNGYRFDGTFSIATVTFRLVSIYNLCIHFNASGLDPASFSSVFGWILSHTSCAHCVCVCVCVQMCTGIVFAHMQVLLHAYMAFTQWIQYSLWKVSKQGAFTFRMRAAFQTTIHKFICETYRGKGRAVPKLSFCFSSAPKVCLSLLCAHWLQLF